MGTPSDDLGLGSLRVLLDALPDGLCLFQGGKLVYANRALARLLGEKPPHGITIDQFVDGWVLAEDRAATRADLLRASSDGQPVSRAQRRYRSLSGELTVEVELLPLLLEEQESAAQPAVLMLSRDVSERGRVEARLLQADRMTSIGILAAGIAHEINNPLAFVVANLQFLSEQLAGSDAGLREALTHAQEGAARVQQVVKQLRGFSVGGDERRLPVDLRAILDASVLMVSHEIAQRAKLVRHFDEVDPVLGSEPQLTQVFVHLLVNAAHAIPENGAANHEIRLSLRASGNQAVVEVADTGSGILPENLRRIFDPFFTTKPIGLGTGMGLSICHGIVTAHHGEISVESEPGRGTTFRVTLPLAARLPDALPTPRHPTPSQPRRGRVLVIDDEPRIGAAIRRTLLMHEVVVMTSARDALTAMAAGEHFDLVLCDVMMPEMSGMDFFEEMTRDYPELARHIVFLSGGAFTPRAQAFLAKVPNPLLEKPFDPKQLRALVQTLLR